MDRWQILKVAALVVVGSAFALAGTICPAAGAGGTLPYSPDNAATGCNVVITIPASGSISIVIKDSNPYENSEDALIGVVNNSASPVGSLNLSGSGIFGFEGDGICAYTFVGSGFCAGTYYKSDPGDYAGPTSTFPGFSFSSPNTGTVAFSPAIPANGGTTFFSLEGVPTANVNVTPGGPSATPAPSSILLMLTALAGVGLFFLSRRFAKPSVQ
jgi:hypothetical protein